MYGMTNERVFALEQPAGDMSLHRLWRRFMFLSLLTHFFQMAAFLLLLLSLLLLCRLCPIPCVGIRITFYDDADCSIVQSDFPRGSGNLTSGVCAPMINILQGSIRITCNGTAVGDSVTLSDYWGEGCRSNPGTVEAQSGVCFLHSFGHNHALIECDEPPPTRLMQTAVFSDDACTVPLMGPELSAPFDECQGTAGGMYRETTSVRWRMSPDGNSAIAMQYIGSATCEQQWLTNLIASPIGICYPVLLPGPDPDPYGRYLRQVFLFATPPAEPGAAAPTNWPADPNLHLLQEECMMMHVRIDVEWRPL
jgi:hypothetical protein